MHAPNLPSQGIYSWVSLKKGTLSGIRPLKTIMDFLDPPPDHVLDNPATNHVALVVFLCPTTPPHLLLLSIIVVGAPHPDSGQSPKDCSEFVVYSAELCLLLGFLELKFIFDEIGSELLDSSSLIDPPKMQSGLGISQFPFLSIYDLPEDG
ncbi:hypothetical protein DM860_012094 [Cuscuta australis]|uniref:Uncharacterized protein n=1 Tax=Cuscuta australis TaxID=267555 RepID=A0A328DDJ9_9ASTE|nr:hypothetical protein DM860_012094 [Cuscuta australis]